MAEKTKEIKKEKKEKSIFNLIAENLVSALVISGIIVFIIPFVLVLIFYLVNKIPGNCLVIPENNQIWFGFYGSYIGSFFSLILTFLTIKLTVEIQDRSETDDKRERAFLVATRMPNFACTGGAVFYIDDGQPRQFVRYFQENNDFILKIDMKPAFPPYFAIKINKVEMEWTDLSGDNRGKKIVVSQVIQEANYHIINNEETQMLLQLSVVDDSDLETVMKQFYYYRHITTEYTIQQYEILSVKIYMTCRNVLIGGEDSDGDVSFAFHIDMKNGGDDFVGKKIVVENRVMKYHKIEES